MSVSTVGGAASLPVPLSSSVGSAAGASTDAVAADPSRSGSFGSAATEASQTRSSDRTTTAKATKEVEKAKPLPPLKGLTVAEIRAMLGVALPVSGAASAASGTTAQSTGTASAQALADRYA